MAFAPTLLTFQDVVDYLVNKKLSNQPQQVYRQAVASSYDDLSQRHDWKYFWKEHQINLVGPEKDLTITFDLTGGTNEREITFNTAMTGDLLTNAIYYRIIIASVNYPIATKVSSTVVTLPEDSRPQADVAAGTACTLYRNIYTLPPDFKNMVAPHGEDGVWGNTPVSMDDWLGIERHVSGQQTPRRFSIGPDPNLFGSMAIYFADIPDTAEGMRFMMRRFPRRLFYHGHEATYRAYTLTASADANTATTTTALPAGMVGSVLRTGDTSNHPDSLYGTNPYVEQKVITGLSTTTVTLDSNWANAAAAGTKFTVSDPIDLRPTMLEALYRGSEWKLSTLQNDRDEQQAMDTYFRQVRLAMESDAVTPQTHTRDPVSRSKGYKWAGVTTEGV
jgi:hypothetical protein